MGGGKPKKPLSALDKQRKKELKALRKVQREERKTLPSLIDDSLIRRAERTVKNLDLVTPSVLASALSIKVSVARKLIKMMIEKLSLIHI
mgnify:CR=1 FL=1